MTCSVGYGLSAMSPRAKGPGRPRKFRMGDTAYFDDRKDVVVVDYKATPKDSYYRIMRLPILGKAIWVTSTLLDGTGRVNTDALRIYRANERLEDRECDCQCCVHQAIPRRNWRDDVDG